MTRPPRVMLALLTCAATTTACVQQAYDRTVVYELDVSALDSVRTVGVRGGDTPLSWETDSAMTPVTPQRLYRAVVTYHTGFLKTEVKFTVNGRFELDGKDNRRVAFDMTRDTTVYRAVFDTPRP